ncbi:MAG: hypothetical protein LAQ69_51385 [Acidobacteriia bacterium]|nr:hypothetical protein [Terriglobia bacterium]
MTGGVWRNCFASIANRGTYFYNVGAWLDRLVYAPEPMSSYYEIELERKLEALDHY